MNTIYPFLYKVPISLHYHFLTLKITLLQIQLAITYPPMETATLCNQSELKIEIQHDLEVNCENMKKVKVIMEVVDEVRQHKIEILSIVGTSLKYVSKNITHLYLVEVVKWAM